MKKLLCRLIGHRWYRDTYYGKRMMHTESLLDGRRVRCCYRCGMMERLHTHWRRGY